MKETDFLEKWLEIKKPENYVPRNFQTVGGMWTVDTYKSGDWTAQLMDEGYTKVLTNHATRKRFFQKYDWVNSKNVITEESLD